jgi:predicted peptidase
MMVTTLVMAFSLIAVRENFESREYNYTDSKDQQLLFHYRLFVPRSLESMERYPLLVWLHGLGQAGSDNQQHLIVVDGVADETCRLFILAVQCPKASPYWCSTNIDATVEILKKTMREQTIDPNRIYLAGISSGGTGCWGMAMRYPELFAAVVPMASSNAGVSQAARLVSIPIWAFINEGERKGVEDTVMAVKRAGGNAHLTVMQASGHDSWSVPMHTGIVDWMLAQHREAPCWTPPGCHSWQWWHILTLPCALLLLIRVTWFVEQRRRNNVIPNVSQSELEPTDDDFAIGPIQSEYNPLVTEALISQGAAP